MTKATINKALNYFLNSYLCAGVAGSVLGLSIAAIVIASTPPAHAGQVKTLVLEDTEVVSGVRLCTYNNAGEVEVVKRKEWQQCPYTVTVEAD